MMRAIPRSGSRKANGYVKAVLALEAVRRKREDRYVRVMRPLDRRRDALAAEVATRLRALSGGQPAAAQPLLAMIAQATANGGAAKRGVIRQRVQQLLVRHGLEPADDATGPADRLAEASLRRSACGCGATGASRWS